MTWKSAVTILLAGLAHLQAEVEVVAVQLAERLVEADVADRPRREREDEAVDGVHLARARVRRPLLALPGERREIAAAELAVAVDERRPGHRALPPRDAAHADRADAAHDADLGVAERLAQLRAEAGVVDLGVLVQEDERLEVVALGDGVEEQVVGAEDRPRRGVRDHLGIRLRGAADPGRRGALVDVAGSVIELREHDHRARLLPRSHARGSRQVADARRSRSAVAAASASRAAASSSASASSRAVGTSGCSGRAGARTVRGSGTADPCSGPAVVERRHRAPVASTLTSGSSIPWARRNSSTARRQPSNDP